MIITQGDIVRILERPIVAVFITLAVLAMVVPVLLARARVRGRKVELEVSD